MGVLKDDIIINNKIEKDNERKTHKIFYSFFFCYVSAHERDLEWKIVVCTLSWPRGGASQQ